MKEASINVPRKKKAIEMSNVRSAEASSLRIEEESIGLATIIFTDTKNSLRQGNRGPVDSKEEYLALYRRKVDSIRCFGASPR
jgi:hypothetical protein